MFRKMESIYPVLDKEEPPEDQPGGQNEEPGRGKDQEERDQHQEEKYLEEACQEVQREITVAIAEACQDYKQEIQAATRKLEIRTAGKRVLYNFLKYPAAPSKDATILYPTPVTRIQIQTSRMMRTTMALAKPV